MNAETARPYRMVARAANAEANGERILDAAVAAFWDSPSATVSLDEVARRAGVTVQTVIRRFGGRAALVAAAVEREGARVASERDPTAVAGRPEAAIDQLLAHYEQMGDRVVRMTAEEARMPELAPIADRGRALHRDWCAAVFATFLHELDTPSRRRRLAELVAVCDVQTWKLLRRDAGLSVAETRLALLEMLRPLLEDA
jgi:AcrR family transcriptional regulator